MRPLNVLAALAAMCAIPGTINTRAGEGLKDTTPKPPPDENVRAKKRAKFAARGQRRYARWLKSRGSLGDA